MQTKKSAWKAWHGFAIEIGPDTDLRGEGILMYEYAAGGSTPVACVSTPNEAQEIAASYKPEAAGTFKLWARGIGGRFLIVPLVIDGRQRPLGCTGFVDHGQNQLDR
jgi:hypothetical protein